MTTPDDATAGLPADADSARGMPAPRSGPQQTGSGPGAAPTPPAGEPAASGEPRTERRARFRREEDRRVHHERAVLARVLDAVSHGGHAEDRLGVLLGEIARASAADRVAVLREDPERRVIVALAPGEPPAEATSLADWLDGAAQRSRAERAASGRAVVETVTSARLSRPASMRPGRPTRTLIELPAGSALGLEFGTARAAVGVPGRLTPPLLRHLGSAIALLDEQAARERDLGTLRARDEQRTRFVSTVAHELRTPLTGLGGYLDLILGGRVEDVAVRDDFLERSRQIVLSMSDLVGDLLELSRLDSGSLQLEVGPFSMAEVGQRVVDRLLPIAMEHGLELRAELPPRLRSAIGDRRRAEQILTNLLGNALKFTQVGGIVELLGWTDAGVALFAVRDDGAGVAAADRDRIFERFYRVAEQQRITGTGLGLPIARDLARAMHGDLAVASVPGSGSSFILALPGPAPVDPADLAGTLGAALAREELHLEERAVRRAIRVAGRSVPIRDEAGLSTGSARLSTIDEHVQKSVDKPVDARGGGA